MKRWPLAAHERAAMLLILIATLYACPSPPPQSISLEPPAVTVSTPVGTGRIVTVARPEDTRRDPTTVGEWSFEQSRKTVASDTDIAVWVGDAVVSSLQRAGFRVERSEMVSTAPNVLAMSISIRDAEANFRVVGLSSVHGEARVVAKFQIYDGGKSVFARTFSGSSATDTGAPTAEEYRKLLNQALDEMLRQASPTLIAVLASNESKS